MSYVLKTNKLCKKYKTQLAVNCVDMNIEKGDIYGFVGANGAGKTTIIRLISGLAAPTSGEFELFSVKSTSPEIAKVRKKISAVVEAPSIYGNMTAFDNLSMQCRILGISEDENATLLKTVGLWDVAQTKRKAGNYSLGMRQRLGIAMALVGSPEFIALDEPMNGLDPQGIVDVRSLILSLNREKGTTFLISSHILSELSLVANKFGIISQGKLIEEITAEELHNKCRKCIDLECENAELARQTATEVLGLKDCRVAGRLVSVFDDINVGQLVAGLYNAGVHIEKIACRDENIEDHYLAINGGAHNA